MPNDIYIIGCGGHARSVADIALSNDPDCTIVFIDPNAKDNEKLYGLAVLKEKNFTTSDRVFVAIGDNKKRNVFFDSNEHLNYVSIISHTARIGIESKINAGTFIGNFVHIGPQAKIGKQTIINNGAIVEHEVSIGDYCHIGPNVAISGRTKVGDNVFIGVGATVINNISICSNVIVGAGATVTTNITESGTYVGVPAKKILK